MHKLPRFVCDSGGMSATVGVCSEEGKTIKMLGLTHVIT